MSNKYTSSHLLASYDDDDNIQAVRLDTEITLQFLLGGITFEQLDIVNDIHLYNSLRYFTVHENLTAIADYLDDTEFIGHGRTFAVEDEETGVEYVEFQGE